MNSAWQYGLRSNNLVQQQNTNSSTFDELSLNSTCNNAITKPVLHKGANNNKRVAKGRAALGDISNRSYGVENGGMGFCDPKAKKTNASLKPSFTIATENNRFMPKPHVQHQQQPAMETCDMDISIVEDDDISNSDANENLSVHQRIPPLLDPCDVNDIHNPKYAAEYVGQIYKHFRSVETKYMAKHCYMDKQTDINVKMRALLVDWLLQVHVKFELLPQTLYLTINVLDRFLEVKLVPRRKLQLVGCAAMLAASKYEEIYAPECTDFVSMSDNAFTVEDLLKMESTLLNTLGFHLTTPSSYTFLRRYMKVASSSAKTQHFATFLVERSLQEYDMLSFYPSELAATALYIAQHHTEEGSTWGSILRRHTGYEPEDFNACVESMKHLYTNNQKNYLQAVNKKYATAKYMFVSLIAIA